MTNSQQRGADYILKPAEIKKLVWACDNPRDRCIIKLFAYTGIRREELQQLDIQDLDFERNRIYIREGKGDKSRIIPVAQSVMADLKFLISGRQKGSVFLSQKGGRIALTHINWIVRKVGDRAGVKNPNPRRKAINPHLFRHSFSRNALNAGMDIRRVSQMLGHASIKTTVDVYGTPSVDDTQQDYEQKIEGMYG